jgi:Family of unknown function (DUF6298)
MIRRKSNKQATFALLFLLTTVSLNASAEPVARGPLRVHSNNPRYFTDDSGKAIYLAGSSERNNFQLRLDSGTLSRFSYDDFLNTLTDNRHNFIRLWAMEHAGWSPLPYQRLGPGMANDGQPKFDLNYFNQAYFDELRRRVIAARDRGIYVGVMLFQGWSIVNGSYGAGYVAWDRHPFQVENNVNGINGDADGNGEGQEVHTLQIPLITAVQKAYVRKVVDTLNDLDNIIWEISNESPSGSVKWQYHMIAFVKEYEATKPKQHLVWMSALYGGPGNSVLFASPADVVSPVADQEIGWEYRDNPPAAEGKKIIINDTDHMSAADATLGVVWKGFTRGMHLSVLDGRLNGSNWPDPATRTALGHTRYYADRMNLAATAPHPSLSSTTYAIATPGSEYLVYQPIPGPFTVDLKEGVYSCEWFNPISGRVIRSDPVKVSDEKREFTPPFDGQSVLYLKSIAER